MNNTIGLNINQNGSITLNYKGGNAGGGGGSSGIDAEGARDIIGAALVGGAGISIVPNDGSNTITISATGGVDSESVRDTIAAALVAGSGVTITPNDGADTITISAAAGLDAEAVRDIVGATLVAGNGITITPNDAGDTILISADPELIRDTIAAALVAGNGIVVTADDNANTITITATATQGLDAEAVRDTIAAALVGGTGISITNNDIGDTITISATGSGGGGTGGIDAETARDTIAAALVAGSGITITPNDGADTITVSALFDAEMARDTLASALVAGANTTITADDAANTITIASITDVEVVRDTIAAALVAGSGITISADDAANTITIAATGAGGMDAEGVRDTVAAALVAGTGITITNNDAGDTITIAATGVGGIDAETARDTIAAALVAGNGITITNNDAGDTITIAANKTVYATRSLMKAAATAPTAGDSFYESETGGWWTYRTGNFATLVTADTRGGMYLQAGSIATSTGALVRTQSDGDIVNVLWFMTPTELASILAANYTVNVTVGIRAAATMLQTLGRGTLLIPPGGYLIGQQTFQGTLLDQPGQPAAYGPSHVITIKNAGNIRISGYGAVLKTDPAMRYGSFSYSTGARIDPAVPYYDYTSYASPYRAVINLENNASVLVEGLELDGNNQNITLGGQWGDSQRQLEASGVRAKDNGFTVVRDVNAHHQPLDGFTLVNAESDISVAKPAMFINCSGRFNARQGCSLVGGKNVTFMHCDFSQTGRAMNGSEAMQTAPGHGIDIEAEVGLVRDVTFYKCRLLGNYQGGLSAASGNSARVSFVDCFIEGAIVQRYAYSFTRCTFNGKTSFALETTNQYDSTAVIDKDAMNFDTCRFLMDATLAEGGTFVTAVQGQSQWNQLQSGHFRNCNINMGSTPLPYNYFGSLGDNSNWWENCTFRTTSTAAAQGIFGRFRGINRIVCPASDVSIQLGSQSVVDYGTVYLNGAIAAAAAAAVPTRGIPLIDDGNTRVSPVVGGYLVEKIAGATGYNAAAISVKTVTGDHLVRIHWIDNAGGAMVAGVSTTPTASDSYDFPGVKILYDGSSLAAYSGGGQIGSLVSGAGSKPYAWIKRTSSGDKFEFYWGTTDDIAAATLFHTVTSYGLGDVWSFDSSLQNLGASMEVAFIDT